MWSEAILEYFHKQHETEQGNVNVKVYIKSSISFSVQLKSYFFLPIWLSLTLMEFVFPEVDTILLFSGLL